MANLNKVMLIGRLTRDPELRYTPSGTAVCDLGIAISRTFTNATGERKEEVCFVDVTVWQKQAESCAEYLKKGREVFIEGRLIHDRWETKEGEKRSKIRVTAERVQFLSGGGAPKETTPHEPPSEEQPIPEGSESAQPEEKF